MKRFLILFMILGLIAGSVATAEAEQAGRKRVERTVEGTYDTQFVPYGGLVTNTCDRETTVGCVIIETRSKEAFFSAKVEDAHGQPVLVTVTDIPTPFGVPHTYGTFCGETKEPIAFDRGEGLRFSIGYWDPGLPTNWASCPPGFGTTGTVSVTLSNLP